MALEFWTLLCEERGSGASGCVLAFYLAERSLLQLRLQALCSTSSGDGQGHDDLPKSFSALDNLSFRLLLQLLLETGKDLRLRNFSIRPMRLTGLPASAGAPRHLVSLNDSGSSVQVPLQAFNKCIFAFQTGCVLRGRLGRKGFLYFPILFNGCLVKTRWWNCTGDMQRSHWLPFAPFPGPQLVQYQRPLLSRMACARMAASVTKCDSRRDGEMTSGSRNECESVRRVSERNILS